MVIPVGEGNSIPVQMVMLMWSGFREYISRLSAESGLKYMMQFHKPSGMPGKMKNLQYFTGRITVSGLLP